MIDLKLRSGVRTLVFSVLLSLFLVGHTYSRDFPPISKRGTLNEFERPFVKIGSQTYRLSPGALIRDQSNSIILPAILPAGAKVVYKLEPQTGFLHELWLLAPGEVVTIQK